MKDGVVHQCAGPLEIYHRPANRFVAGFLGTPPMNFFAGRLIDEAGRLLFDEGTAKLPVPAWAAPALRERPAGSADVVMGVRPEALVLPRPGDSGAAAAASLPMKLWLVQPLGAKMDVYLSTARHERIVAHVDARPGLGVGATLPVAIDMDRVHFFEPGEVGLTIASHDVPPS
jgi:multiple sugar transport system ATP-binding protein